MEEIKKMIDAEIAKRIEEVSKLKPGTDEYSIAVNNLAVLHRLRIDEEKIEIDSEDRREKRRIEENLNNDRYQMDYRAKEEELKDKTVNRYWTMGLEAGMFLLTMAFRSHWMKQGFLFEETGTFTSDTFKWFRNRDKLK